MRHAKVMAAAAVAVVAAGSLAACSAADQKKAEGTASASQTVTVQVHDAFNLPDSVIDTFEKETGYTLVTNSSGDATVASSLILTKDQPTADAFYGLDYYTAYTALDAGVIEPYVSAKLPEDAQQYVVDNALTPIDMGDVCVNVDHQWFTDHNLAEPATISDLAEPEYAKLLVTENAASSTTGLSFLIATIADQGTDGYQAYWKKLLSGGARVAASWSDAYYSDFSGADGKGDYPLVVSYSTSPAETKGATGSLNQTCTRQIEYAGVVKGASNSEGAKAFVDFMLSDEVQGAMADSMYMYPINTAIQLPTEWTKYATLAEQPLSIDAKDVAANKDAWIKAWTAIYEAQ